MVRVGADGMGLEPVEKCEWLRLSVLTFTATCSGKLHSLKDHREGVPLACRWCHRPIRITDRFKPVAIKAWSTRTGSDDDV